MDLQILFPINQESYCFHSTSLGSGYISGGYSKCSSNNRKQYSSLQAFGLAQKLTGFDIVASSKGKYLFPVLYNSSLYVLGEILMWWRIVTWIVERLVFQPPLIQQLYASQRGGGTKTRALQTAGLGKPSFKKSAVFLTLFKKPLTPPPFV